MENEYEHLRKTVYMYLSTYGNCTPLEKSLRDDLWELVKDYEPSETEQGLIPIPDGYKEP